MKRMLLFSLIGVLVAAVVLVGFFALYPASPFRSYSDVTWSGTVNPGNFTVGSGVRLTIEPGTVVNFNNSVLQIDGVLVARGSADQKILFNGSLGGKIVFTSSSAPWTEWANSGCIMDNCNSNCYIVCNGSSPKFTNSLLNASNSYNRVLVIDGGAPIVTDNLITGSLRSYRNGLAGDSDILFWSSSNAVITGNVIQKGMFGIALSFVMDNFTGTATIQHNLISGNYEGVALGAPLKVVFKDNTVTQNWIGISVSGYSDQSVFSNNNIYGNTNQSLAVYRSHWSTNMTVPNNWWGTTDI